MLHLGRMILELTIVALSAYLIGSIPFGLLLTKAAGLGDIRTIGSGNIGATNVLRTGNKKLAALTLLLDGFKGFAPLYLLSFFFLQQDPRNAYTDCLPGPCYPPATDPRILSVALIAVILGHCFPIWLKFKGGKGVATALGATIGLSPFIGLGACLSWLLTALLFRISSLSALVAMLTLPGFAWYLDMPAYIFPLAIIAAFVFYRHKDNIKRLLAGTEPKIGQKK